MRNMLHKSYAIALGSSVLVTALMLPGCGGTMAFQGEKAFAVTGSQAAPPPPPPPPTTQEAPKPEQKRVAIRNNKIEINEKIQFEHDKATILPVSHGLLDEITQVLKDNPSVKKVLIEGHASAEGDAKHNLTLSDERAKSVMAYLVSHGIDKDRLRAQGFGSTEPIADNGTEQGREKNRRVEFTIKRQDHVALERAK